LPSFITQAFPAQITIYRDSHGLLPRISPTSQDVAGFDKFFHELDAGDPEMPVSCKDDRALAIVMNEIEAEGARPL
jgi:hypothetical protein